MTSEHIVGLVLIGLLIFQQVYYTMILNRLVNKLMSRNYADYIQSQNVSQSDSLKIKLSDEPEESLDVIDALGPQF